MHIIRATGLQLTDGNDECYLSAQILREMLNALLLMQNNSNNKMSKITTRKESEMTHFPIISIIYLMFVVNSFVHSTDPNIQIFKYVYIFHERYIKFRPKKSIRYDDTLNKNAYWFQWLTVMCVCASIVSNNELLIHTFGV